MTAVDAARAYIGVPWVHQGRNPAIGIDCIGLLVLAFGPSLGDATPADYSRDPHGARLESELQARFGAPVVEARASRPIELATLQPGDIGVLSYGGPVRHVGLIGDHAHGVSLIHTDSRLGRVVEQRIDDRIRRMIRLVFRPEVAA